MRTDKELLQATRPFAVEQRGWSWFHLVTTAAPLAALMALCCTDLSLWVRIPASILAGLVLVRLFIVFHDQQHGSIFRNSRPAGAIMWLFGIFTLNPPTVWKATHDHHHANNCKHFNPNVGSFPLMTVADWETASFWERLYFRASRHPLTMLGGYLTVFGGSLTVMSFLESPRRHWDAGLSLVCHIGTLVALALVFGIDAMLLAVVVPMFIGSAVGAYMFFAQHNFPGVKLQTGGNWDYVFSALHSSSYMRTGPILGWFTGNIGYHHVHHLNAKIPFYRLPEAMAAIPELQTPVTLTLWPRDILACLRLKLWDEEAQEMVPWPQRTREPAVAVKS